MTQYQDVLPRYILPSRTTKTRYLDVIPGRNTKTHSQGILIIQANKRLYGGVTTAQISIYISTSQIYNNSATEPDNQN